MFRENIINLTFYSLSGGLNPCLGLDLFDPRSSFYYCQAQVAVQVLGQFQVRSSRSKDKGQRPGPGRFQDDIQDNNQDDIQDDFQHSKGDFKEDLEGYLDVDLEGGLQTEDLFSSSGQVQVRSR